VGGDEGPVVAFGMTVKGAGVVEGKLGTAIGASCLLLTLRERE
jgi:hypothetical protein